MFHDRNLKWAATGLAAAIWATGGCSVALAETAAVSPAAAAAAAEAAAAAATAAATEAAAAAPVSAASPRPAPVPAASSTPAPAAAAPAVTPPAPAAADCNCASPYREYKNADTPQTEALFAAVSRNDEAAFLAALAQVERPGDYARDGVPLLHALLMPPPGLRSQYVYWDMTPADAARLRQTHEAGLPARARMLAALLATKPALNDITYESRRPPLHLALLYGTPEIMETLLAAGANPDQRGDQNNTPLEFLLHRDFEFAVRQTYLPRLVDRKNLTRMVVSLFGAGAGRPYAALDAADKTSTSPFKDGQGKARPAADFLSWLPLVELTEGADALRALAATGSRPAYEEELTALAFAAYEGDAQAASYLMEQGPRTIPATAYGETGDRDVWLDAAQAAVEGGHPAIAEQLLRAGMPFAQRGPQVGSGGLIFAKPQMGNRPIMNLAAQRGDTQTVQRLLALGAPVDGDPAEPHGNTPLADAVEAGKTDAVKALLAGGADPGLRREGYDRRSALEVAVRAGDTALLRTLLAAMKPDALRAALQNPADSPVAQLLRQPGGQGAAVLRMFADAGFDMKTLDASAIRQALESRDTALAMMLIEAGVPVNPSGPDALPLSLDDPRGTPPLLLAATSGQVAVVDALLAKGADPAAIAPDGESALYWLIGRRDATMLDRLLHAGARLDDPRLPVAPERYALLNAAVVSGDMETVRRVSAANGQPVGEACLPDNGEFVLIDKPGYFAQLHEAGFTGQPSSCARDGRPLPERIVSMLLQSRQLITARHETVVQVLGQLKESGIDLDAPLADGDTPLNAAIRLGRRDLAQALLDAGASPDADDGAGRGPAWIALETGQPAMLSLLAQHHARFDAAAAPSGQSFRAALVCQSDPAFARVLQDAGVALQEDCAPPPAQGRSVGSKAASKSSEAVRIPGHYYLRGVREVGSELLLLEDGSFEYFLSYGAVDINARGAWRSDGSQVFLDTPPLRPYSAIASVRADTRPAEPGMLTVRVYHRGRPVSIDVAVSSADQDLGGGPRQSEGADGVSVPIAAGAMKALAVFVPVPSGGRWHEVDVAGIDAATRAVRIDVDVPDAAASAPLHKILVMAKDGALVETAGGRELRYMK
ncbi:ankyrin repeat domain-containing protein [Achromobacter sp.]|uniref:ankyrin repeat domain-containing protein n=1 Tax=Achromobacter sp. TaxID=134375 RepID=UPI0028AA6323|nr:ankyrin repeat domain-containing protein [Achromobacter sp.]